MNFSRLLGERYTPLYFLNALGAGLLALSCYMYLFWLCKIEYSSLPTFETLFSLFSLNNLTQSIFAGLVISAFLFFIILHVRLLQWNAKNFKIWKDMVPYKALMSSKDHTVLLTIPATLSVSVSLLMIIFMMALPFARESKEFFFPVALAALSYGAWRSLKIYMRFWSATLTEENTSTSFGSNLGQLLSVFSFLMMSLPFSLIAQTASWHISLVYSLSATFFLVFVAGLIVIVRFLPRLSTLSQGPLAAETTPLFWFAASIAGTFGLLWIQVRGGTLRTFSGDFQPSDLFHILIGVLAVQAVLGLVGKMLLKHYGFLSDLINGKHYSTGLYAVLLPALSLVFLYGYFVNGALVSAAILFPFSLFHLGWNIPLFVIHGWAIIYFFDLNRKVFSQPQAKRSDKPAASRQ